ncbi:hypothetical protein MKW98_009270 [Papaver atlanticum]|uniref:Uncharacterized protein n=1 Tax=Papaver atlanticum TaxID=357466 RepID=A0AAD4T0H0_9MAGN|nr:hypothetical protein MKW98_009270 [Papaver atlanticum]
MANARWVSWRIMGYMKDHIKCKPSTIMNRMKRKHGVTISYWTAWHARHMCLREIFGSYEKSYRQVPELCRQILLENPGSIAKWSKDIVHHQFEGLFVMFVMEDEKLLMETLYLRQQLAKNWSKKGLMERAEGRLSGHRDNVRFFNCYPSTENVWLVENDRDRRQ